MIINTHDISSKARGYGAWPPDAAALFLAVQRRFLGWLNLGGKEGIRSGILLGCLPFLPATVATSLLGM